MSFPIEKRRSTAALDGKVSYLMSRCGSFSCDANEAKGNMIWQFLWHCLFDIAGN